MIESARLMTSHMNIFDSSKRTLPRFKEQTYIDKMQPVAHLPLAAASLVLSLSFWLKN